MGIAFHTTYAVDGLNGFNATDRVFLGANRLTYAGGAASLVTSLSWSEPVPTPYFVDFDVPEGAVAFATSRTALTMTVTVAAITGSLAGGSLGILLFS